MINFKKVRWKNLLSSGNRFTEIELDKHQTTLILGENGAGKSTLLDALCFGLYGKGFRNLKKDLLINSINEKELVVEIEFSIGKKNYKVIRGAKPNKFELYINDFVGFEFEGDRFDCGSKVGYLKANIALGLANEELSERLKNYIEEIKDL